MDTDLILVMGIVIAAVSLPPLLNAYSGGRVSRSGAIFLLVGAVMILFALTRHSPPYSFQEIPKVFVRVIGRYTG